MKIHTRRDTHNECAKKRKLVKGLKQLSTPGC